MFQNVSSPHLDANAAAFCYDAGMTVDTEQDYLITDAQRETFFTNGFIRLDNIISERELDWYRERYDAMFSDESKIKQLGGKDQSGRATLPQILAPSKENPEFLNRPYQQRIHRVAQQLLGPEAKFIFDHMILKPAGYGVATPWHQDQAYHRPTHRYFNINFWMPLEDVDIEGGCMQYVRYTHGGAVVPHRFLIPGCNTSAMVADNQDFWMANATPLPCPAGSVCLHLSYCMHYAAPNRTERPRRAYISIYQKEAEPLEHPITLPWQQNPWWPDPAPEA